MKQLIFGVLLVVIGICLGLYVGVWVCFIGGIVDVITQIRAESLDAMIVAIGIFKVIGAGFCGVISAIICIVPGCGLIVTAK